MVSFPRIVTPQANQIDMLIRILLARSILDLAEDIPESLSTSSCDLLFSGIPQPTGGLHLSAVLDAMGGRLQSWPTSPLVVLAKQCLEVAPNPDVWAVNLYLIIFLGTATFAQALLSSGATLLSALGPRAKLDHFLRGFSQHPAQLVSDSTRAGRVLAQTLAGLGPTQAKRVLLQRVPSRLTRPAIKIGRQWAPKKDIIQHILRFQGFGPFLASAYWQLYRLRYPTYPSAVDGSFGLLGPGARSGLNWLLKYPPLFAKEAKDKHSADFFADQISRLQPLFSRHKLLRHLASDSDALKEAKTALRLHLETIEGSGYACCEYSKVINTILSGSPVAAA